MSAPASGPATARVSVGDPIGTAIDWTKRSLFEPFDLGTWMRLGFCAWLAWIGQGGGNAGGNWTLPGDEPRAELRRAAGWVDENLTLFAVLVAAVVLLIVALIVLFTWLSSRGKLMFVDGVVNRRGAVVEPWHRFREIGDSLFFFRVVAGLIFAGVFIVLVAPSFFALYSWGVRGAEPSAGEWVFLAACLLALVPVSILALLFGVAVNDVLVPIQWLRGCRALEAFRECRGLLARNAGSFVLYALMKLVFAVATVAITCVVTCATCCLAALPYIGVVILLPLYVFGRAYSLHFLSQFGPGYWALVPGGAPWIPPPESPPA